MYHWSVIIVKMKINCSTDFECAYIKLKGFIGAYLLQTCVTDFEEKVMILYFSTETTAHALIFYFCKNWQ